MSVMHWWVSALNNHVDQPAINLALRMRRALLQTSEEEDCEVWALALAERVEGIDASPPRLYNR
jgi:AraC family transcriptional regulator